jgi:hypothetical protein
VPLRLSAWCGLLAPVAFTLAWLVGGLAQPDSYSTIDDSVSDLGALTADSPWLYNQIGANLTGLLVLALAAGLWKTVPPRLSGRVGVVALGVMGVGQFFDGLFRLDCQGIDAGCGDADLSWHANAHEIESLFTVLGLLVSVFALARAFKQSPRWHDLRAVTLTAGFATIVVFVGLLPVGGGLAVLGALSVWFAWLALVSYRLLTVARELESSGTSLSPA